MKRLIALLFFALACFPSIASANRPTDPRQPNRWCLEYRDDSGISTQAVCVDFFGHFMPGYNLRQDLGESTHSWRTIYAGNIVTSSGIVNIKDEFISPLTYSTATLRAGGFAISTANVINQTSTYYTADISTMPSGRNIVVVSASSPTFGGISTTVVSGNVVVYGVNMLGMKDQETINFTTYPANPGVSSTTVGQGNVAWASISSFTISVTSITADYGTMNEPVYIYLGQGTKFGLTNEIVSASDIYFTQEGTNNSVLPAANINTQFNTVVFQNNPNGSRSYAVASNVKKRTP